MQIGGWWGGGGSKFYCAPASKLRYLSSLLLLARLASFKHFHEDDLYICYNVSEECNVHVFIIYCPHFFESQSVHLLVSHND